MLTEDDKARIQSEEVFRDEVRRQLQEAKARTLGGNVWGFFNSAFGLWLVSSILFGLVTWSYSTWSDSRARARENEAAVEKLDVEIAARVDRFRTLVSNAKSAERYYSALWYLDNPSSEKFGLVIFPEFGNRSLRSLLWELRSRVSRGEKAEVSRALQAAETLSTRGAEAVKYLGQTTQDVEFNPKDVQQAEQMVDSAFHLPRWTDLK
jgi:hypothetical protein